MLALSPATRWILFKGPLLYCIIVAALHIWSAAANVALFPPFSWNSKFKEPALKKYDWSTDHLFKKGAKLRHQMTEQTRDFMYCNWSVGVKKNAHALVCQMSQEQKWNICTVIRKKHCGIKCIVIIICVY